jgi:hypothetical protein
MGDTNQISQGVVSFISALLPLYRAEYVDREIWARSLRDGTVIKPISEPIEDEDGRVEIWWQGDKNKTTIEHGVFLVRLVLSDYVDFHSRGKPEAYNMQMQHLTQHFYLKTGKQLGEPEDSLVSLLEVVSKALDKLGPPALLEILRKTIGL